MFRTWHRYQLFLLVAFLLFATDNSLEAGGVMSEVHVFYTTSVSSNGTLGALFQPDEAMVRTDCSVSPRTTVGLFRAPLDGDKHQKLVDQVRALSTFSDPRLFGQNESFEIFE